VPAGGLANLGVPVHLTPALDDALHVHGTATASHAQQASFRLRGGDTREGPHLRVRELSAGERLGQSRQRRKGVRDAHVLPGSSRRHADPPRQPFRAGAEAGVPAAARVELADQGEQPRGGGIEMGRQLGDLVAEAIELLGPSAVRGRRTDEQSRTRRRATRYGSTSAGLLRRGDIGAATLCALSALYTPGIVPPGCGPKRRSGARASPRAPPAPFVARRARGAAQATRFFEAAVGSQGDAGEPSSTKIVTAHA